MGHTTVRISGSARDTLRRLSEVEGRSMQAVLEQAVEDLRRKRFLEEVNAAYASLQGDPKAWAAVERERRQWEATLLDGLTAREAPARHRKSRTRTRRKKV